MTAAQKRNANYWRSVCPVAARGNCKSAGGFHCLVCRDGGSSQHRLTAREAAHALADWANGHNAC